MSYCINPSCSQPKNPLKTLVCQACGSKLLLRNRYLAMKSLGKGGFGATFLAVDLSLPGKPTCVIKQLRPSMNDPEIFEMAKELFEREAQTLGRIGNHPQIPRLLDYFEANQQFYLVQEYVHGNNLQREIKQNGTYTEVATRQFLSEILPILDHIHSQEVIHRDIKPANLIRRQQDSQLVLIDFGAVKTEITQPEAGATGQTALTAFAVGTTGYAPPEQLAMRPVFASDIYAVGATCIYLLTGKPPKDIPIDPNSGEIMWRKYVEVNDGFARVLNKMLESSVKYRYKSANEALNALNLEPYHDTLSQGLTSLSREDLNPDPPMSGMLNAPPVQESAAAHTSIRAANLATQIRARRQRQAARNANNGSLNSSGDRYRNTSSPQTQNSALNRGNTSYQRGFTDVGKVNKNPRPANTKVTGRETAHNTNKKLDSDTIIKDYSKGRRDFAQQDLNNLNLQKTHLSGGNFYQSKLIKANFGGANLSGTDFGRAILIQAILRNANLSRAYLSYTNLEGADLRGADLSFASLNYANLKGANLCGANLRNAKISERQLSQAKTNWATIMPSGKRGFW
ncbi:MAG: serine/threonine-protein kinase [Prochloraceae cyanobacterium]|nr:serine/threonine-protein kinase [Prochloraceae cyanobacterium]